MARRFTAASSEVIQLGIQGAAVGAIFGPATMVAVIRRVQNSGGASRTVLSPAQSGGNRCGMVFFNHSDNISYYSQSNSSEPTLALQAANGWGCIAISKAAGSATPRHHRYLYSTNTWTHVAGTGATANGPTPGAGGTWHIGNSSGQSEYLNDDLAAVAYVPREMSDGEIERLCRGGWGLQIPDAWLHVEFPSGIDNPAVAVADVSRLRQRQSAITGTTRSPLADPPGFRFSPLNRRR